MKKKKERVNKREKIYIYWAKNWEFSISVDAVSKKLNLCFHSLVLTPPAVYKFNTHSKSGYIVFIHFLLLFPLPPSITLYIVNNFFFVLNKIRFLVLGKSLDIYLEKGDFRRLSKLLFIGHNFRRSLIWVYLQLLYVIAVFKKIIWSENNMVIRLFGYIFAPFEMYLGIIILFLDFL